MSVNYTNGNLSNKRNFGVINELLNANKALIDAKQLGLGNIKIFSFTLKINDVLNLSQYLFSIPDGYQYVFIGVSYQGVDGTTRLNFTFPNVGPEAYINSAFGYYAKAGILNTGDVRLTVTAGTPNTEIIVNVCVLTN